MTLFKHEELARLREGNEVLSAECNRLRTLINNFVSLHPDFIASRDFFLTSEGKFSLRLAELQTKAEDETLARRIQRLVDEGAIRCPERSAKR